MVIDASSLAISEPSRVVSRADNVAQTLPTGNGNVRRWQRPLRAPSFRAVAVRSPQSGVEPMLRSSTFSCGALFVTLASASPLAGQQPTLEALLSAPFPSAMRASPEGGHFAWVQDDRGSRNIWIASPPDYRGRQLTTYAGDDGREIDGLTWSPDGKTLIYSRGGAPNRAGEFPNPTSDPAGGEQGLWGIALLNGEPVRIGGGSGVAISPRGDLLAFVRGGQAWTVALSGDTTPAALFRVRGGLGSVRWSPDGARLAFVSNRGDHAFVGVYAMEPKTITWLAPSVDRDTEPAWSPDGTRVAFLRIPASSAVTLFKPVRAATPWSILVADAATGAAREIWRARPGAGSAFRGVVADQQLHWMANDRIAFPWEADGWTHLYSVPSTGGEATLLTAGDFEVEYVTLRPDRRAIVYNSNEGDIDRRHLWRVEDAGGPPVRLTQGDGIEWQPAVSSDGVAIAYLASDARRPAHAQILSGDATPRMLAPQSFPSDFPVAALVVPEPVIYESPDGMKIHAQLFRPADLRTGERRPAVIFMHGGSRRQMLLGWHYNSYYHNAYALNQYLATRGYVVLSINFRSGIGYGMEFREALSYGAAGGSEFNDVVGAGEYLRSRDDVDPARIGLWGGSYGGYLTALGLGRRSDMFAAGVDIHGVHDWNVGIRTFMPSYNRLEDPEAARIAFDASPMSAVDGWRSPVLVIHGDDDRNVSFAETVTLVEALRDRGVHVEILVFPDEVHGFLRHDSWLRAYRATEDFFERKLKGSSGLRLFPASKTQDANLFNPVLRAQYTEYVRLRDL
jgi:dipeptidyl aminopeptidase/acylaminoacyl peptidase